MNKTKISFGLLILFFTVLILGASIFYQEVIVLQRALISNTPLSGFASFGIIPDSFTPEPEMTRYVQENSSCKAYAPSEPTVILRMDDLGAWHYYDTSKDIVAEILSRDMSIGLGVIPHELEKDDPFVEWIHDIKDDPRIEITQHGNHHTESEFKNLNSIQAFMEIDEGKQSIIDNLKVEPVTFIPPSNDYNNETLLALEEAGFEVISGRGSEYRFDGDVAVMGSDTHTVDYYEKRFVPVEEVLAACQKALQKKGLCVITLHPQDFVQDDDAFKINKTKYAEFLRLLDGIEAMNAESRTFKDFVKCEPLDPSMSSSNEFASDNTSASHTIDYQSGSDSTENTDPAADMGTNYTQSSQNSSNQTQTNSSVNNSNNVSFFEDLEKKIHEGNFTLS